MKAYYWFSVFLREDACFIHNKTWVGTAGHVPSFFTESVYLKLNYTHKLISNLYF